MRIFTGISITVLCCVWINAYALTLDAIIDFSPRIDLSLPVSGIVDKVKVSAGQHVKQGETMISLDEIPFIADRALMQSHVAFQQARLDEASRDFKHQQELYDRTVLSTVELENAELRVKRSEALLASAKARLARANYDYSVSQLKAPFDALIIAVNVNAGQAINNAMQSQILVSLVRHGYFTARFNVTAGQLENLKPGKPVKVVINDNRYAANITAISYEPVEINKGAGIGGEQRYTVEAGFFTDGGSMPVGKKASVVIE